VNIDRGELITSSVGTAQRLQRYCSRRAAFRRARFPACPAMLTQPHDEHMEDGV